MGLDVGSAYIEVLADLVKYRRQVQEAAANTPDAEINVKVDDSDLKDLDRALSGVTKEIKVTQKETDRTSDSFSTLGKKVIAANQGLNLTGKAVTLIKWPAIISGASYAAKGINTLLAGTTALIGSLSSLAGLVAAYPAILGAMGQAAGVVALAGVSDLTTAVGGLNTKLDKSATAFQKLSPQAKQLAIQLDELKKPIRGIQGDVQKPLFAGISDGVDSAMKNLPAFDSVLTSTSHVMADLARDAGQLLGRKGFGEDLQKVGENNAQLLGRMGEAGLNLGDALRYVMVAAEPLVDFLGRGVVNLSKWVEQTAKAGEQSGDLRDFFQETRDEIEIIVPLLSDFGAGIWNIVRAGKPLGDDIFKSLADSAEEFRQWTESASGENAIVQWFEDAKEPLEQAGKLILAIGDAFFDVGQTDGLSSLLKTLRKDVLPVIVDVLHSSEGFGPVFVDFATSALKAFKPFLGATGVLTLFVEVLTHITDALGWLEEHVPGLGSILATALTIKGISSFLSGSSFFGLGKTIGTRIGSGIPQGLQTGARSAVQGAGAALGIAGVVYTIAEALREPMKNAISDVFGDSIGSAFDRVSFGLTPAGDLLDHIFGGTAEENIQKQIDSLIDATRVGRESIVKAAEGSDHEVTLPIVAAWQAAGKISEEEARRIINAIKHVNSVAAQNEARTESLGFGQAAISDSRITDREMKQIGKTLEDLHGKAKQISAQTTADLASEWHEAGLISDRTFKEINSTITDSMGKAGRTIIQEASDSTKKGKEAFANFAKQSGQSFWNLNTSAYNAFIRLGQNMNEMISGTGGKPVQFSLSKEQNSTLNQALDPSGYRSGGTTVVPGTAPGDRHILSLNGVPIAKVESQEGVYVVNREAQSYLDSVNKQVPRWASGGLAFALGPYTVPPIQYDANHAGANEHVHISGTTPEWVVGVGHALQDMGYLISENPAFGGVTPGIHASYGPTDHYHGGAIDVNDPDGSESLADVTEIANFLKSGKVVPGGVSEQLAKLTIKGPKGPLRDLGQGAVDKVRRALNTYISKHLPTETAGAGSISADGQVQQVFADVAKKLSTSKTATLALGEAGYAESDMQDLAGGDSTSEGALQLLASTAASMGIDPHDEGQVASAFLLRGYYGKGGANALAASGLSAPMVAQSVQGSAFSDGSNYAAREGQARAWMSHYGLQEGGILKLAKGGSTDAPPGIMESIGLPKAVAKIVKRLRKAKGPAKQHHIVKGLVDRIKDIGLPENVFGQVEKLSNDAYDHYDFAEIASSFNKEPNFGIVRNWVDDKYKDLMPWDPSTGTAPYSIVTDDIHNTVQGLYANYDDAVAAYKEMLSPLWGTFSAGGQQKTYEEWLNQALGELWQLRNRLIEAKSIADDELKRVKDSITGAQSQLDQLKKAIKDAKDAREKVTGARKDLMDEKGKKAKDRSKSKISHAERLIEKFGGVNIHDIGDTSNKSLDAAVHLADHALNGIDRDQQTRQQLSAGVSKVLGGLNSKSTSLSTLSKDLLSNGSDQFKALEDVQGPTPPISSKIMKTMAPVLGEFGGDLLTWQKELGDFTDQLPTVTDEAVAAASSASKPEGLSIGQLREFAEAVRYGAFSHDAYGAGFAGFMDKGGKIGPGQWAIAGEVGPEIIHGPARVTSTEDSRSALTPDVRVIVEGGPAMAWLKDFVRVEIDDDNKSAKAAYQAGGRR